MDYGELIHDFVDGTLDSGQEGKLFSELASNDGLRSELKSFIEFERTARFDTMAYAPSAQTTAGIFAKVGITNPAFNPATTAASGSSALSFLGKYTQGIVGGIVTAILTSTVMFFAMNNSGESNVGNQNNFTAKTEQQNNSNFAQTPSNIPIVTSVEKQEPKVIEKVVIKYIEVPVDKNPEQSNQNIASASDIDRLDNLELTSSDEMGSSDQINIKENMNQLSQDNPIIEQPEFNLNINEPEISNDFGVGIELSAADYFLFNKGLLPKAEAFFINKKIAFTTDISTDWKIGLEIRQEQFYHDYNDDKFRSITHTNNYVSTGLLLRWTPVRWGFADMFGQITAGGNFGDVSTNLKEIKAVGPVGRLMFGMEFRPSTDYSIMFGIEGSSLYYQHEGTWHPAFKYGFHYGFIFNL